MALNATISNEAGDLRRQLLQEHRGTSQIDKLCELAVREDELMGFNRTDAWDDVSRAFEDELGWYEEPV